jgi:hypothetical protein
MEQRPRNLKNIGANSKSHDQLVRINSETSNKVNVYNIIESKDKKVV